jgi:hypothetical protein
MRMIKNTFSYYLNLKICSYSYGFSDYSLFLEWFSCLHFFVCHFRWSACLEPLCCLNLPITFGKLALADYKTLSADLLRACLAKRFFKDICFLVFCKMKMSTREATLNLHPDSYRDHLTTESPISCWCC